MQPSTIASKHTGTALLHLRRKDRLKTLSLFGWSFNRATAFPFMIYHARFRSVSYLQKGMHKKEREKEFFNPVLPLFRPAFAPDSCCF
ncbi:hypothetical protein HK12_10980 [Acetobacter orientalis]|uniref:Uncharacterized protein n=1 Tax=Acetobacter orientalis TaxID=146474 RepID=A0A251ZZ15_9PROT|nr:hypothetical protein HK12_10980 [Acetobacter orientalis]